MSGDRSRLSKLLAKEQALRSDVGQDKPVKKTPDPVVEHASIVSPQNLEDTRKRLRRLLGSSSPLHRSGEHISSSNPSSEETKRSSRPPKPTRSKLLDHVLNSTKHKDDSPPPTPQRVQKRLLISTPVEKTKPIRAAQSRSLSPTLIRGGHYSLLSQPAPKQKKKGFAKTPSSTFYTLQSTRYNRSERGRDNNNEEGEEGAEEEDSGHDSEERVEDSSLLEAIQGMQTVISSSKDALETFEFLVKRNFDCFFDISSILSSLHCDPLQSTLSQWQHQVHGSVSQLSKVLNAIDLVTLQVWLISPSNMSMNAPPGGLTRFFRVDSKKELNLNLLRHYRPFIDHIQGKQSAALFIPRTEDVFDDLVYVMEDSNISATGSSIESIVMMAIQSDQTLGHPLAILLAAVHANPSPRPVSSISAPRSASMSMDGGANLRATALFLPNLAESNLARMGEYLQSLQSLIHRLTVERVGRVIQMGYDRLLAYREQQHLAQSIAHQELVTDCQKALLTLSQLFSSPSLPTTSPPSSSSVAPISSISSVQQILQATAVSCPFATRFWVFLTKKQLLYDEHQHQHSIAHTTLPIVSIHQRVHHAAFSSALPLSTAAVRALLLPVGAVAAVGGTAAVDSLQISVDSEEADFLLSTLDVHRVVSSKTATASTLHLLRSSFEVFPSDSLIGSTLYVTFLAELPSSPTLSPIDDSANTTTTTWTRHLQDLALISKNAFLSLHASLLDAVCHDLACTTQPLATATSQWILQTIQNRNYSVPDVMDFVEEHIQSKVFSGYLHAKKVKMLFSSDLAHSLGFLSMDGTETYPTSDEMVFHYLKHHSVHSLSVAGGQHSLWLQDILQNKIVLFTPGQYRPLAAPTSITSTIGEEFASSSLQSSSRSSLFSFLSTLFNAFHSSMLIPIQTQLGLAVMVIVDYLPLSTPSSTTSRSMLSSSAAVLDPYTLHAVEQVFTQSYAQALLSARIPEALTATFQQIYHVGTIVHEAVYQSSQARQIEEENNALLDKVAAMVVRFLKQRVFSRWRENAQRLRLQRESCSHKDDQLWTLRLLLSTRSLSWVENGSISDPEELLSKAVDSLIHTSPRPTTPSGNPFLEAVSRMIKWRFPGTRVEFSSQLPVIGLAESHAGGQSYERVDGRSTADPRSLFSHHTSGDFDVVAEVTNYCSTLENIEKILAEEAKHDRDPASLPSAERWSPRPIGWIRISRRDREFSLSEKKQLLRDCRLAGVVYSAMTASVEVDAATCGSPMELLLQCLPSLLAVESAYDSNTVNSKDRTSISNVLENILGWIQHHSNAREASMAVRGSHFRDLTDTILTACDENALVTSYDYRRFTSMALHPLRDGTNARELRVRLLSPSDSALSEELAEAKLLLPALPSNTLHTPITRDLIAALHLLFHVVGHVMTSRHRLDAQAASIQNLQLQLRDFNNSLVTIQGHLEASRTEEHRLRQESALLTRFLVFLGHYNDPQQGELKTVTERSKLSNTAANAAVDSGLMDMAEAIWKDLGAVLGCGSCLLAINEHFLSSSSLQTATTGDNDEVLSLYYHLLWPQTSSVPYARDLPQRLSLAQIINLPNYPLDTVSAASTGDTIKDRGHPSKINTDSSHREAQAVIRLFIPETTILFGAVLVFFNDTSDQSVETLDEKERGMNMVVKRYKELITGLLSGRIWRAMQSRSWNDLHSTIHQQDKEILQLRTMESVLDREKQELNGRLVDLQEQYALLQQSCRATEEDLQTANAMREKDNARLLSEVHGWEEKYSSQLLYSQERIQQLERDQLQELEERKRKDSFWKDWHSLVQSFCVDDRTLPHRNSGTMDKDSNISGSVLEGGGEGLLWLRDVAEHRDAMLFVAMNNALPEVLTGIVGLHAAVLEAQRIDRPISFVISPSPATTVVAPSFVDRGVGLNKKKKDVWENAAILVIPRRLLKGRLGGLAQMPTAFIFVRQEASFRGEATEFSEEDRVFLETASDLTSKSLFFSFAEGNNDGAGASSTTTPSFDEVWLRLKSRDRLMQRFRQVHNHGRALLSQRMHSLADIRKIAEEMILDLLVNPYAPQVHPVVTVTVFDEKDDRNGDSSTNNKGQSTKVLRDGNRLYLPILSIFKRRSVGQIVAERTLRDTTGTAASSLGTTAAGGANVLSIADLLLNEEDEEILTIFALYLAHLLSKAHHISTALETIEQASQALVAVQSAKQAMEEQCVHHIMERNQYDDCQQLSADLLTLASHRGTTTYQLIEMVQREVAKVIHVDSLTMAIPLNHDICEDMALAGFGNLKDLSQWPRKEERNGFVAIRQRDLEVAPFETSDLEFMALEHQKLQSNIIVSGVDGEERSTIPSWTLRRYLADLRLRTSEDSPHAEILTAEQYSVMAVPFPLMMNPNLSVSGVHDSETGEKAATSSSSSRMDKMGLVILIKFKGTFTKVDLDITRFMMHLMTYCLFYRNNTQQLGSHVEKLGQMQKELTLYQNVEKEHSLLMSEQEQIMNILDLLEPIWMILDSQGQKLLHEVERRCLGTTETFDQSDGQILGKSTLQDYLVATVQAIFYASHVEFSQEEIYQRLPCDPEHSFEVTLPSVIAPVASKVTLKLARIKRAVGDVSIGMDDGEHEEVLSPYPAPPSNQETILAGLLHLPPLPTVTSASQPFVLLIKFGAKLPSRRLLLTQLRLVAASIQVFGVFSKECRGFVKLVNDQQEMTDRVVVECKSQVARLDDEWTRQVEGFEQQIQAQQQLHDKLVQTKQLEMDQCVNLWKESVYLADRLVYDRKTFLTPDMALSSLGVMSQHYSLRWACGSLLPTDSEVRWLRNDSHLVSPAMALQYLRPLLPSSPSQNNGHVMHLLIHTSIKDVTSQLMENYQGLSGSFRDMVSLHTLPLLAGDHNGLEYERQANVQFSALLLIPADIFPVTSSNQSSHYVAYFSSPSSSMCKAFQASSFISALFTFALHLLTTSHSFILASAQNSLQSAHQSLRAQYHFLSSRYRRSLLRASFISLQGLRLERAVSQAEQSAHQSLRLVAQSQYLSGIHEEARGLSQAIHSLEASHYLAQGVQTLWCDLQKTVLPRTASNLSADFGLLLWMDQNNRFSLQHTPLMDASSTSTSSYRLVDLHLRSSSSGSGECDISSALMLGNRVHATLMDIFDPNTPLEDLYLVPRQPQASAAGENSPTDTSAALLTAAEQVIYLVPIRSQGRAIAVLRAILPRQEVDINDGDNEDISGPRSYTASMAPRKSQKSVGKKGAAVSGLNEVKRWEARLIHVSRELAPLLVYCRSYEEIAQKYQVQSQNLGRCQEGLERLAKDVESAVAATGLHREIGHRFGHTMALAARCVAADRVIRDLADGLASVLNCGVKISVAIDDLAVEAVAGEVPVSAASTKDESFWRHREGLLSVDKELLGHIFFTKDVVSAAIKPYLATFSHFVHLLAQFYHHRTVESPEREATLRQWQEKYIQENRKNTQLSGELDALVLLRDSLQGRLQLCTDVIYEVTRTAYTGVGCEIYPHRSFAVAEVAGVIDAMQGLLDRSLSLCLGVADFHTGVGLSVAILNASAAIGEGVDVREILWVHATLGEDVDARQGQVLVWESLPSGSREVVTSVVRTAIDQKRRGVVELPATDRQSQRMRIIALPLIDVYVGECLGALVLRTPATHASPSVAEMDEGPMKAIDEVAISQDLTSLLSRYLSFALLQESLHRAHTSLQIDQIHAQTQMQSLQEKIVFLDHQMRVWKTWNQVFLEVLQSPNQAILEVICDHPAPVDTLREEGLFLVPRAERIHEYSRAEDKEAMEEVKLEEAITRSTLPLSEGVALEVAYRPPAGCAVAKHEILAFAYRLVETTNSYLSAISTARQRLDSQLHSRQTELMQREEGWAQQTALVEKWRAKADREKGKLKETQATLTATLAAVLQSTASSASSTTVPHAAPTVGVLPSLSSIVSHHFADFHQRMARIIAMQTDRSLREVGGRRREEKRWQEVLECVAQTAQQLLKQYAADSEGKISLHWSIFQLSEVQGDLANVWAGRLLLLAPQSTRDATILRDDKLTSMAVGGSSSLPSSALDVALSSRSIVQRVYPTSLSAHPTDLFGVEGISSSGGAWKVTVVPILLPIESAEEEASGEAHDSTRRAVAGAVRLVLHYPAPPTQSKADASKSTVTAAPDQVRDFLRGISTSAIDGLLLTLLYNAATVAQGVTAEEIARTAAMGNPSEVAAVQQEQALAKSQLHRLKKLHRVAARECLLLFDPPGFHPTDLALDGETKIPKSQHVASLPAPLALQDVAVKVLQVVRNLLRSEGQGLLLQTRSLLQSNRSDPRIGQIMYTGDAIRFPGILPAVFGTITLSTPSIFQETLRARQTVFLSDVTASIHYNAHVDGEYPQPSSMLAAPVRGKAGAVIGVLFAVRSAALGFTKEEQVAVELMALVAGLSCYWCDGLATTQHGLHKALEEIDTLQKHLTT